MANFAETNNHMITCLPLNLAGLAACHEILLWPQAMCVQNAVALQPIGWYPYLLELVSWEFAKTCTWSQRMNLQSGSSQFRRNVKKVNFYWVWKNSVPAKIPAAAARICDSSLLNISQHGSCFSSWAWSDSKSSKTKHWKSDKKVQNWHWQCTLIVSTFPWDEIKTSIITEFAGELFEGWRVQKWGHLCSQQHQTESWHLEINCRGWEKSPNRRIRALERTRWRERENFLGDAFAEQD